VPGEKKLTLAHPRVQAARERWDQSAPFRKRTKNKLSFRRLFKCFNEMRPLEEISLEAEISAERIRQLYNKYFRNLVFDGKSIRTRTTERTFQKRLRRKQKAARILFAHDPFVKHVIAQTQTQGFTVKPISYHHQGQPTSRILKKSIVINDRACLLHKIGKTFRGGTRGQEYARVNLAPDTTDIDAHVIVVRTLVGQYQVFIVPVQDVRNAYPKKSRDLDTRLYIPITPPLHGGHKPRIHFKNYKEAWHLLSASPKPPTET